MSWLGNDWKYRIPFSLHNATAGGSRDGQFLVPADLGKFWDNTQTDFDDVRVTEADGITLIDFAIANGNHSNRTATIQFDAYDWSSKPWGSANSTYTANTAGSVISGFIYFGNTTASSGQTNNLTISNAVNVGVEMSAPGALGNPVLRPTAQRIGQTETDLFIVKGTKETTRCWWDLSQLLYYRRRPEQGSVLLEEIAYVQLRIDQQDGQNLVDRTSVMIDAASVTFSNGHLVQHTITAGASGADYLLQLLVGTDDGMGNTRVLDVRATLKVQDLGTNTT